MVYGVLVACLFVIQPPIYEVSSISACNELFYKDMKS